MTEVKNKMKKVLAAATTAATASSSTGGGTNTGSRGRRKDRGELTLCPHCNKKGMHKPMDCYMLPVNVSKKRQSSLMEGLPMRKRMNDKGRGMIVKAWTVTG